jgi:hypothetical protein
MEQVEMSKDELNRLNLFEALVFGIYGNWLISFVEKISFLKYPASFSIFGGAHQGVCVGLSFSCLLILFAYSIFRPQDTTKWFVYILYVGHIVGNYGAFSAEGWTISNLAFSFIGTILFVIIFFIEVGRIRIRKRNDRDRRKRDLFAFFE